MGPGSSKRLTKYTPPSICFPSIHALVHTWQPHAPVFRRICTEDGLSVSRQQALLLCCSEEAGLRAGHGRSQ